MLVIGDHGPNVDEAVAMNSRMNPSETTLVKVQYLGHENIIIGIFRCLKIQCH